MNRPRIAAIAVLALAAAVGAAGCGAADDPLPPLCTAGTGAIERALQRAPGAVTLADGTRLSQCVARARSSADLQEAGSLISRAADHLRARADADAAAALQLGYLIGAVRRGGGPTSVQAELVRRVEQSAGRLGQGDPAIAAALARGLRAGEATG